MRYIPVPTGNSLLNYRDTQQQSVYPCTYRELDDIRESKSVEAGISLYLQGTPNGTRQQVPGTRYIPVPTGNSLNIDICFI